MSKNVKRFVRGQAGPKALSAALDELGVREGEEFLVARLEDSIDEFAAGRRGASRDSDPTTSKSAGEMTLTGEHVKQVFQCFVDAREHGLAAFEVVNLTGIRGAWKRVSDLKQGEYIVELEGVTRRDEETQRESAVFVLTDKGMRAGGVVPQPVETVESPLAEQESFAPADPSSRTSAFDPYD